MLDEYICWRDHTKTEESKITKNIGPLHRARQLLTEASLKTIYFSYIHSHLNYANIAWPEPILQNYIRSIYCKSDLYALR